MSTLRDQLRLLLANRNSAEAEALFLTLARYTEGRVRRVTRARFSDLISQAEMEELVGEVLLQLMAGSLAQFRGETLPELLGFVRSITDRCVVRTARRRIREKHALDGESATEIRGWSAEVPGPEQAVRMVPDSPLDAKDQEYLLALFEAGSRAEYAKQAGISRAAVTQRVQRIRLRIEAMPERDRAAAEAWFRHRVAVRVEAG